MKRVLITGGLGFVGTNLVDQLLSTNEVTVFDDLSSGRVSNVRRHLQNPKFKLLEGSLLDHRKIDEAIAEADEVVHLAAVVSVIRSLEEPNLVHRTNVEGTLNVLEGCRRHSVKRMIFASSAAIYGNNHRKQLTEEMEPNPSNLYGATKVAGEAYVKAYHETHDLGTTILRMMNVYGPGRFPGSYAGVITRFAEAASRQEPLTIYGDGEQTRDFVYVSDVIDAIVRTLENRHTIGLTLNIGTGTASTINEVAAIFSRMTKPPIPIHHLPPRQGEVRQSWASIERAKKILDYKPKVSLSKGIESYVRWFHKNHEVFSEGSYETKLPS